MKDKVNDKFCRVFGFRRQPFRRQFLPLVFIGQKPVYFKQVTTFRQIILLLASFKNYESR